MNIDELPTYVKHSELYRTLVKKNIKIIEKTNIHLFKVDKVNTFEDFKELLKTIYFWKIDKNEYPVEFYIYINGNLDKVRSYLYLYKNKITDYMMNFRMNNEFLVSAVHVRTSLEGNFTLLGYIIENNLIDINKLFFSLCNFGNLIAINHILSKYKIDINYNQSEALCICARYGNFKLVELLLKNGANINPNNKYVLGLSAEKGHLDVVKLLLDYSVKTNNKYTKNVLLSALDYTTNIQVINEIINYIDKYLK